MVDDENDEKGDEIDDDFQKTETENSNAGGEGNDLIIMLNVGKYCSAVAGSSVTGTSGHKVRDCGTIFPIEYYDTVREFALKNYDRPGYAYMKLEKCLW